MDADKRKRVMEKLGYQTDAAQALSQQALQDELRAQQALRDSAANSLLGRFQRWNRDRFLPSGGGTRQAPLRPVDALRGAPASYTTTLPLPGVVANFGRGQTVTAPSRVAAAPDRGTDPRQVDHAAWARRAPAAVPAAQAAPPQQSARAAGGAPGTAGTAPGKTFYMNQAQTNASLNKSAPASTPANGVYGTAMAKYRSFMADLDRKNPALFSSPVAPTGDAALDRAYARAVTTAPPGPAASAAPAMQQIARQRAATRHVAARPAMQPAPVAPPVTDPGALLAGAAMKKQLLVDPASAPRPAAVAQPTPAAPPPVLAAPKQTGHTLFGWNASNVAPHMLNQSARARLNNPLNTASNTY